MPQDAFHIRRLATELNTILTGGKVNRISQVNKDELTFIIYTGKSTVKLILSANASNARVCLSLTEKEPAPVAPNFCMLLRKHLQGAEILGVKPDHSRSRRLLTYHFDIPVDYTGVWQIGGDFDHRFWPKDDRVTPVPFSPEVYKQNGFIRFENGRVTEMKLSPR